MAINIKNKIYINGTSFTSHLVQPIKWGNFLDERLDEMYFTLQSTKHRAFQPMDKVELVSTLTNPYRGKTTTRHKFYLIANDKATEEPVGSGHYTHELYCIELTKMLEMYVVDSLTFTNVIGTDYTKNPPLAPATLVTPVMPNENSYIPYGETWIPVNSDTAWNTPSNYRTPLATGKPFTCASWEEVDNGSYSSLVKTVPELCGYSVWVEGNDSPIFESTNDPTGKYTFTLENGRNYIIRYQTYSITTYGGSNTYAKRGVEFTFAVVQNYYPSKRLTCTDVINRLCDLATPLYQGETPRFVLDQKDAADFDKIYCPEITMTQSTLRENLQEVGKIVHGEPRLVPYGFDTYRITYDRYGGTKKANRPTKYIEKVSEHAIDSYCSSVDSAAQNLVNSLNYAQGVICEPRADAYKTVRAETQYVRVTDANMIIKTTRPIYKIIKLECGLVKNNTISAPVDITPYVFEKTVYDAQLSSYSEAYPYSKAYALYYAIGSDTIGGLNFKVDSAWLPSFERYAIVNILDKVTGQTLDLPGEWNDDKDKQDGTNFYPSLAFRVTYVPYFNVRLTQSKPYIREFKEPAVLIYNQSANVIESRAYGENLKGAVARLGNPERSITYWLTSFAQIPEAGDLYDDDYYISTVACEMYGIGIKCTLGLSKNFNRKSAYIGVSSERRLYEVSERAAYDRTTLYKEYIVIGDEETTDNTLLGDNFISAIQNTFTQTARIARIDKVTAWGGTYSTPTGTTSARPLPAVELPVVASALGNAIVFIWSYQDNYSAGPMVAYESNGGVSGYYQQDYAYCDFYGKIYYYNFDLSPSTEAETTDFDMQTEIGLELPGIDDNDTPGISSGVFSTLEYKPYIYRKDSREISQFCAEVEFVTNRKDLIIGSGLAARNPLVGAQKQDPVRLYLLPFKINKFIDRITDNLDNIPYIGTYIYPTYTGTYANVKQYTAVSGTSTVSAGTYYTTQDGVISNAETNASGQNVYTDYLFNCKTGAFKLVSPVPLDSISPGRTWYSTDIDGNTGAETGNQIYWFQLNSKNASSGDIAASRIPITAIANTGSAIFIEKISENGLATDKLKMDIITDISGLPDYSSWAFISPQYTQTETVEDEEGNIYAQTYYDGGDVYIGANTPINGDALYFTAIHDPFKQYEVIATSGGTLTTISGYKYARYDEGVGRFFVDTPIKQNELSVNDIVFNVSPYGDYPEGDTLTQSTVTAISENSITVSNEIIRRKIWTSS